MSTSRAYDATKRNGWAKGLIHFHTRFSDGWASLPRAGEIARRNGYDFLIVMDHLRDMMHKHGKTLSDYTAACDAASLEAGLPVVPGGEIEIPWKDAVTADFSEAHALLFSVRPFAAQQTSPSTGPLSPWLAPCPSGTVGHLQQLLKNAHLPSIAGHQFQHSYLSMTPGKWSDYRHDVAQLKDSRYFDFFYSSLDEVLHETEDIVLVNEYAGCLSTERKAIFASCDFHVGTQALWPPLANIVGTGWLADRLRGPVQAYQTSRIKLAGKAGTAASPPFEVEQLSHATYVHLGEGESGCTEERVLQALAEGRTCVTRGEAEFTLLEPVPGFATHYRPPVTIRLDLPVSFTRPRPRCVIIFRDGEVAHWEPYPPAAEAVRFAWQDPNPLPGPHTYSVYMPSKFLSSPIVVTGP